MAYVDNPRVKLNICILTYRRPDLLSQCLASLVQMQPLPHTQLLVTVIENDKEQSSRTLVESFASQNKFILHYRCEPTRGIPVARNHAVEFCLQQGCDYIVFIDDDEWVAEDWLIELFGYCQSLGGDVVVSGKVVPIIPETTPAHIRGLVRTADHPTGSALSACATNNVIFPIRLVRELQLRFDASVPLAGGTDTKFFLAAHQLGVKILRCSEAVVYERVPAARLRLRWLAGRKYRAGITQTWRRRQQGQSVLGILLSAVFSLLSNSLKALVFAAINHKLKRNQAWLKVQKALGACAGLGGKEVESYKVTD